METEMTKGRFTLITQKDSSDMWGWNGWLKDLQTGKRYPLVKVYVDYELDGEVGYAHCAFDTKEEMRRAAIRKARKIEGVAA